ncbi:MAG: recombinase family protein [Bacillaceae bacterium]
MALAAIYLRLSKDEENQGIDQVLDNHRRKLVKLANKQGMSFDIYQEIQSGVDIERQQLNLLLSRLEEYEYIIVHDLDRITRDNIHAEQIKLLLIENNIKILTPSGEIDVSNEINEMMFSFQAIMANYEWKQIRKRLARGRMAIAEKGYWVHTNQIPLGYSKTAEKKLVIHEEEAKIIRYIFEQTLKGVTANEIMKRMYAFGWRSRNGNVLTTSHINVIRKNPTYYGCIHVKPKKTKRIVEEVFIEDAHEGIVTKEIFLNVQEMLQSNKGKKFRERGEITRALQGIIRCAKCGRKRYIQKDGSGTDYIKACNNSKATINACSDSGYQYWKVEEKVFQALAEYQEQLIHELEIVQVTQSNNDKKKIEEEMKRMHIQKEKQLVKRKQLTTLRIENEITKQEFEDYKHQLDMFILEIDQQLNSFQRILFNIERREREQPEIKEILNILPQLTALNPVFVNQFIRQFIKTIYFATNECSVGNYKTYKRTYKHIYLEIEPY